MTDATPQHPLPAQPYVLDQEPPHIITRGPVPVELRWQLWRDQRRRCNRDLRFYGTCVTCGRNLWAFDDGESYPRGMLGDTALSSISKDDKPRSRTCATCADTPSSRLAASHIIESDPPSRWQVIQWPGMDR